MKNDNRMSQDQLPQQMTLHDDYVPGIKDGSYRLAVQQSVRYEGGAHHYYQDRRFVVAGPRYALPPDDVQARFPPAYGSGNYKTILPHIVLRKRALPWERPVWGRKKQIDVEPAPWLALLVLSQEELDDAAHELGMSKGGGGDQQNSNPLQATVTPKDLVSAKDSQLIREQEGGAITLLPALEEQGDAHDTKTSVQVLDLPIDLFLGVCPRQQDLVYLAHLRCVDPSDKVPLDMHAVGDFSVLIANRFPQPGSNVVFLVSLEGWGGFFLPEDDADKRKVPAKADRVRLVLLDSWTFNDDEAGVHTFGNLMKAIDASPFGTGSSTTEDGNVADYVNAALGRGYVPVEYRPWRSSPSWGWYRGPLSPVPVAPLGDKVELFHRADAALSFDEATGIFDLSYAAAWQLGRLVALGSPSFAHDLREFHDQGSDAMHAAAELETFLEEHSPEVGLAWDKERKGEISSLGGRAAAADALMHFLARLALLYPVPFEYLAAHGKLLPRESMRFFYLDNNWIDALIEGALSIALDCDRDGQVKVTVREELHHAISQLVYQYRRHLQGLAALDPEKDPDASYVEDRKTGFLLRSAVNSGWPGLEVSCYDANRRKMKLLRLDHIGDDLLLAIATGEIKHVVIKEPSEGLRFGLDDEGKVMLRHWTEAELHAPVGGPIMSGEKERKLTFKYPLAGSRKGVVDVASFVKDLSAEMPSTEHFGPAAFALQLTRSPEKQQIDVGDSPDVMIEEPAPQ